MITRFLKLIFGTKVYKIGEHRVESYETTVRGSAPVGVSDRVAGRRKTKYRCVDCEQKFSVRKEFKQAECYDNEVVIK